MSHEYGGCHPLVSLNVTGNALTDARALVCAMRAGFSVDDTAVDAALSSCMRAVTSSPLAPMRR
eukprot:6825831-Lingulodinium_polyedra.AAC.1